MVGEARMRAKPIKWRRLWMWLVIALVLVAPAIATSSCSCSGDPKEFDPGDEPDSGMEDGPVTFFDASDARADTGGAVCPDNTCAPHFEDCDMDASNGCEANLNADPHNCGGCGDDCGDAGPDGEALPAHASPFCSDGGCDWWCPPVPGVGEVYKRCKDKCIPFVCDPYNCGDCGILCPKDNLGNRVCDVGTCGCPFGTVDCDGVPECGQECKDLDHDAMNCGQCGRQCPNDPALAPFHETYTCNGPNPDGGLPDCVRVCVTQPGNLWLDCNGDMLKAPASGDGCETFGWGSVTDCGACGNACKPGEVCHPINATSIQQECGCPKPLDYCPSAPYCRNLDSDPYNCGACDHVCPTPPHAKPRASTASAATSATTVSPTATTTTWMVARSIR